MSAMTPEGKCPDCGDWARDCICDFNEDEECEHLHATYVPADPEVGDPAYTQCLDCDTIL